MCITRCEVSTEAPRYSEYQTKNSHCAVTVTLIGRDERSSLSSSLGWKLQKDHVENMIWVPFSNRRHEGHCLTQKVDSESDLHREIEGSIRGNLVPQNLPGQDKHKGEG